MATALQIADLQTPTVSCQISQPTSQLSCVLHGRKDDGASTAGVWLKITPQKQESQQNNN